MNNFAMNHFTFKKRKASFVVPVELPTVMYDRDYWHLYRPTRNNAQCFENAQYMIWIDRAVAIKNPPTSRSKKSFLSYKKYDEKAQLGEIIIPRACRKEATKEQQIRNWFSSVNEFFVESSLHGLHFLAEKDKRSLFELVLWLLTLCVVYACCGFLIKNSIENYLSGPVVMAMENKPTSISLSPFPAVTVCDTNQIKVTVFNITDYMSRREYLKSHINNSYLNTLDYANILCQRTDLEPDFNIDFLDFSIFQSMMNNAHQTCNEIFSIITWANDAVENPCEVIQPVLTELGLCYSVNMIPFKVLLRDSYLGVLSHSYHFSNQRSNWSYLSNSDWHPQTGYASKTILATDVPRRISGSGRFYAFTAVLKMNSKFFNPGCNSRPNQGYSVLIHSPVDMPLSINSKIIATEGSQYSITVTPKVTTTSNNIYSWTAEQRGCYLDGERKLYFYTIYSQTNCHIECEANYSLSVCGCVVFYQPRSFNTPVCGSIKMDCIKDALVRFADTTNGENESACNCLPACTTLEFDTRITSITSSVKSEIIPNNTVQLNEKKGQEKSPNVTCTFSVLYETRETLVTQRRGIFTFSDFVGNVGGILGLFLGFSIISLVEIGYFLMVRPIMTKTNKLLPL